MPPRGLFAATLFVLLSGSAVFFAGSVAAPAVLERLAAGGTAGGTGVAEGAMTAAVQLGFVAGTLLTVLLDLPDRVAPRRLLAVLLVGGAVANGALLVTGSLPTALLARFAAGALAGPVYPVGMRLLATWYERLGPRLGILLAAYTLGAGAAAVLRALSFPFEAAVLGASALALLAAVVAQRLVGGERLPARQRLDARAALRAYRVRDYRRSTFGYFGHMWELFAFWGLLPFWLQAAGWTGLRGQMLLAGVYVSGAVGCLWAAARSRRVGEARVARLALGASGVVALLSPLLWGAPSWVQAAGVLLWGWMVIADSPMFSALSAAAAPPAYVGSALTVQNSIGFAVPVVPLMLVPVAASAWGWGPGFALLALGPLVGWPFVHALARDRNRRQAPHSVLVEEDHEAAMTSLDNLLHEERSFRPPDAVAASAHVDAARYRELVEEAEADPETFWATRAREELVWISPFSQTLDDSAAPFYKWFQDGSLNAAANCLDRHLPERAAETAILWEAEDGSVRDISYGVLHDEVCRFAGVLRGLGVRHGDRVVLYLPMVPEVAVAMLACARIGAVHSVVFAGFSAQSLTDRILDTGARVVVTADGGFRGGKVVALKANVDEALRSCPAVEDVVVLRRTGTEVSMEEGRDHWWNELEENASPVTEPVAVGAEDPLFILYTSGSTGKPKGIVHSTAGYLMWARLSTRWVFDLQDGDTYWCTADVGWVTGHTYLVYGPLANGTRIVMYEGAPTYPKPDRFWDIVEKHRVTVLYTAPTAIRALMRAGDEWPAKHDLSSLRVLGTVGEPINPEAWMWYHEHIGGGRCPIVDTWWQTETGGILLSPLPGASTLRPGSCGRPLPGVAPAIVDESGHPVSRPAEGGYLVMTRPWPSMLRGIWGDPERYVETYWSRFGNRFYVAGDTARRDADGDHWILGRFDDVLNVSGHRIGTMEVESALVSHPAVAEAAVVGAPDPVTGEALWAFVVVRGEADAETLREHVSHEIGKIARPKHIVLAEGLPKTRSGKIMRRILRSIAVGEEITQDVSTLEDPGVVERLRVTARV